MFKFRVEKTTLSVRMADRLAGGNANYYQAQFEFGDGWDGVSRAAVFRAGETVRSVLLNDTGQCQIPWEVMTNIGEIFYAGVYGVKDDVTVLSTVWTACGKIYEGAAPGEESRTPTPGLWEQLAAEKQNKLTFGHGLKARGNEVSVNMSDTGSPDKTLPISAAAVEATVGNIEILLKTI